MHQLPAKRVSRLLDSVAFMNSHFGLAFNGMVTVNFDQLGLTGKGEISDTITSLNEAVSRRMKRHAKRWPVPHDGEHFFLYAHEKVRTFGHHLHQAIVIPDSLKSHFDAQLQQWARRRFGNSVSPKAVHFRGTSRSRDVRSIARTQAIIVRYVIKTAAPAGVIDRDGKPATLHDLLGFDKARRSSDLAAGRVTGTSQNIALAAQLRALYDPKKHWEALLSDENLAEYVRRQRAQELSEMLARIDL